MTIEELIYFITFTNFIEPNLMVSVKGKDSNGNEKSDLDLIAPIEITLDYWENC